MIAKSGFNKRVAPKAAPRRATRTPSSQYAGSQGQDTASQTHSFPGPPDPQFAQDLTASNVPNQPEVDHHGKDIGSGARSGGDSVNKALLDYSAISNATHIPGSASSRALRAPTVVSTEPPPVPSPHDAEPPATQEISVEVGRVIGLVQASRQTRAGTRSLDGTATTETRRGIPPNSVDEVSSTRDAAPIVPKRPRKADQEVQTATMNGPAFAEADGEEASRTLEQNEPTCSTTQASVKKGARSKPWVSSARNGEVHTQPESHHDKEQHSGDPASTRSRPTRKLKPGKTAQELADEVVDEASEVVDGHRRQTGRKKRKQKNSAQELANEVVDEATGGAGGNGRHGGKKRKHKLGSEEAEHHEIVPAEVKMADLVKDDGLGKTSRREAEMQKIDWVQVTRKRRTAEKELFHEEQKQKEARKNGRPLPPPGPHVAERLVLVNGQMVIDESSRVIDRNAETARDADQLEEAINEDHLTKRVNQSTVGRKPGAVRTYSTWDEEQTEQFFQGLRMFGTDFMMISKMFPGTSRAIIKKKYNKEEKLNPDKILTALNSKEPVDLKTFSEITDTVYEDPKDFYKELEEEQARLEAEDAQMRAEEAQAELDIQESIEQGDEGEEGTEGEHPEGDQSARRNRFAAEAQSIVDGIDSRKKKSKKTPATKKKDGKKGRGLPAEGTEEIVGRIDEVDP